MSTIVIVGLGDVGSALAPVLADAGHQVRIATRRTAAQLATQGQAELLARPVVTVAAVAGAADGADAVLLTVPYVAAADTLTELATSPAR